MGSLERRYAEALLSLSENTQQADFIGSALSALGRLFTRNSEFRGLIINPVISRHIRSEVLLNTLIKLGYIKDDGDGEDDSTNRHKNGGVQEAPENRIPVEALICLKNVSTVSGDSDIMVKKSVEPYKAVKKISHKNTRKESEGQTKSAPPTGIFAGLGAGRKTKVEGGADINAARKTKTAARSDVGATVVRKLTAARTNNDIKTDAEVDINSGNGQQEDTYNEKDYVSVTDAGMFLYRFLQMLLEKGRLAFLPDIAEEYQHIKAKHRSAINIVARSSEPLGADELDELRGRYMAQYGAASAEIINIIESSQSGGVSVQIGDMRIDDTLYGRLAGLARAIAAGAVKQTAEAG